MRCKGGLKVLIEPIYICDVRTLRQEGKFTRPPEKHITLKIYLLSHRNFSF